MRMKLVKDTKISMKKKKSGRLYWTYIGRGGKVLKNGRWHTASKAGETPAILTGALMKSLACIIKYGVMLTYGANTPYARRHELSNDRSYLKRIIAENNRDIWRTFNTEIGRSLNKGKT